MLEILNELGITTGQANPGMKELEKACEALGFNKVPKSMYKGIQTCRSRMGEGQPKLIEKFRVVLTALGKPEDVVVFCPALAEKVAKQCGIECTSWGTWHKILDDCIAFLGKACGANSKMQMTCLVALLLTPAT